MRNLQILWKLPFAARYTAKDDYTSLPDVLVARLRRSCVDSRSLVIEGRVAYVVRVLEAVFHGNGERHSLRIEAQD